MIEGSNHLPGFEAVRRTYGHDFVPGLVWDESGAGEKLWPDPHELLALDPAARRVTSDFKLGDCVIFPMLAFHGSLGNTVPGQLRFHRDTADVRFQPASQMIDPRYSASQLVDEQAQAAIIGQQAPGSGWHALRRMRDSGTTGLTAAAAEVKAAWGLPAWLHPARL